MYLSSLSELSNLGNTIAQLIVDVIIERPNTRSMDFSLSDLYDRASGIHILSKSGNIERTIRNVVYSLQGYDLVEQIGSGRYRIVVGGLLYLQLQQERAYQEMEKVSKYTV